MSGTSLTINRLILEREWNEEVNRCREGRESEKATLLEIRACSTSKGINFLSKPVRDFPLLFLPHFSFLFSVFSLFFFFRGEQKLELLNRDGFEVYQRFVIFPKDMYQAQTNKLLFSLSHSWFVTELESTSFFRSRENDFSAYAENRVVQNFDQKSLFFNISFSFLLPRVNFSLVFFARNEKIRW